ncbi:hypothetical protein VZC37_20775 [Gordonia sp. LSe1-13]|uniref:Alkaline shock response membrane anchor protein AmaP n=1 Tax=Gordonia sesuvii TaxID=3116777 RepID=A0ABU7MJP5_9ACTN|nr:hypothetical protein [Gordonia sp. LSe1-13]
MTTPSSPVIPVPDDEDDRSTADRTADTHGGKVFAPAANPAAAVMGAVIAASLLALGVVAARDLLVEAGWLTGPGWLHAAADWIADIRWWDWMWPMAIAMISVGVGLLWLAVRPRRRTHLSIAEHEVLWTRRVDVARSCSAVVCALPGVADATTVVGRRRAKVSVKAHGPVDRAAVDEAVEDVLSKVDVPLRSKVEIVGRHGGVQRRG